MLKKEKFTVKVNQLFLDLEESKKREIDIVAEKTINKIKFVLVIECKQSLRDSWIFIYSEKKTSRYYYATKHLPVVKTLSKSNVFADTHLMKKEISIVQNYIVMDKVKIKKTEDYQIEEAIKKIPKALINIAADYSGKEKTIYLPVIVFSGQFFTASYEDELKIQEQENVQFQVSFESKYYKKKGVNRLLGQTGQVNEDLYKLEDINTNIYTINRILDTNIQMQQFFLIDLVTEAGFINYLKMLEVDANNISTQKWSRNLPKPVKPPVY